MNGSEKQIAWANDIRAAAIPVLIEWTEPKPAVVDPILGKDDEFIATAEGVAALASAILDAFGRIDDASWWISMRDSMRSLTAPETDSALNDRRASILSGIGLDGIVWSPIRVGDREPLLARFEEALGAPLR